MKKLLATSALFAVLGGAAFAASGDDPATNHAVNNTPATSGSLLDSLLADATDLSASLSNVAENLNNVDGSINLTTGRDYSGLASGIDSISGGGSIPFGSFSTVNANVIGRDLPASLMNVLNPLTLTLGDLSTTAIGAMQSGSITGTVNAAGIVDRVSTEATGSTTSASAMAENFGGIGQTVAMQNIAVNQGDINGSVQLSRNDVNASLGKIGTTAIGAMGSGSLTASITGNMAAVSGSTAGIVNALVGQ